MAIFDFVKTTKGLTGEFREIEKKLRKKNEELDGVRGKIIRLAEEYKEGIPAYSHLLKKQERLIREKEDLQRRFDELSKMLEKRVRKAA